MTFRLFGNKNGGDLRLSEFQKIWSKFCFLDESGSLDNPTQPFFTVGIVKCTQPFYLASKITYERTKQKFYDELKFNKLSKNNYGFAKFVVDAFFSTQSFRFESYSLDKEGRYFNENFGTNPWQAYEDISIRLLESSISPGEILIVLADYISTPKNIKYEVNVKWRINKACERLAIAGVCRFDSKSNDMLQVADLFVGAVTYDLKFATGIIQKGDKYKRRLLEYIKSKFGVKTFIHGHRSHSCNIYVDPNAKLRLPLPADGAEQ